MHRTAGGNVQLDPSVFILRMPFNGNGNASSRNRSMNQSRAQRNFGRKAQVYGASGGRNCGVKFLRFLIDLHVDRGSFHGDSLQRNFAPPRIEMRRKKQAVLWGIDLEAEEPAHGCVEKPCR